MRSASLFVIALTCVAGCRSTAGPIFPAVSASLVWPPPPNPPRIRYIGELVGEESLRVEPSGWEAVQAVLSGPREKVHFSRPTAVAVAGERIFVADLGLAAVHMLDLQSREYKAFRGSESDPLVVPIDIEIVDQDTLVVLDRERAALDLFDLNGNWRESRRFDAIAAPVSAAWDRNDRVLWLIDASKHACFALFELRELGLMFGGRGAGPGEFNFPSAAAFDPAVGLVVADAMNFRVQVFGSDGPPRAIFGEKGDAAGDFARPRDVAVDRDGHIYVLDNQFENVQIFDPDGQLLMAFGQGGQGPGEFSLPSGITIDSQDRIWIADSYNHRVQVFQYLAEEPS